MVLWEGCSTATAVCLSAVALSSGLLNTAVAQESRSGSVEGYPDWVRTREDPEYPSDRFLLGLGMAALEDTPTDAIQQAAARSRADIAKQIRSRVEQVLRDSVREDRLVGGISFSRLAGQLTVRTEESTSLELEGAEVARQWIGGSSVFVLSVLERARAAEKARERIAVLERQIAQGLDFVESLVNVAPLEALGRLEALRGSVSSLVMQYEILSGVGGSLQLPPSWLARFQVLLSGVHANVRAGLLIRERQEGRTPDVPATHAAIEAFLVELGWTVRKLNPADAEAGRTMGGYTVEPANLGIRYLVAIDVEAQETDLVRVGPSKLHFARAGGNLELIDLVADMVLFKVNYPFPSETKAAHRDAQSSRRLATERLLELMLADLMDFLGRTPGQDDS